MYENIPMNFLTKRKRRDLCIGCGLPKNERRTLESYKEEIHELFGDDYVLLSDEYINNKTALKMKHNVCGTEFECTPASFIKAKNPCPNCTYKTRNFSNKTTSEDFQEKIGKDYTLLSEYTNNKTKVKY